MSFSKEAFGCDESTFLGGCMLAAIAAVLFSTQRVVFVAALTAVSFCVWVGNMESLETVNYDDQLVHNTGIDTGAGCSPKKPARGAGKRSGTRAKRQKGQLQQHPQHKVARKGAARLANKEAVEEGIQLNADVQTKATITRALQSNTDHDQYNQRLYEVACTDVSSEFQQAVQ
jgi:hypothetical protein